MRLSRSGASLSLGGVRFWTKKRDDIAAAISGAPAPVVLLAPRPRRVVEASALGIPAVLSGHNASAGRWCCRGSARSRRASSQSRRDVDRQRHGALREPRRRHSHPADPDQLPARESRS
jgi:hypothetical protein